jgi:ATP-dependent protease ClpP protease subunit
MLKSFKFNPNRAKMMMPKKLVVNIFLAISTVFVHPYSVSGETSKNQNINSESPKFPSQSTNTKGPIVINFSVDVSSESVALLMSTVGKLMAQGHKDFLLLINSDGGDPQASIAAYNYLSSLPVTIRTHNISSVKSAATEIYCAGTYRTASPNSTFLLHDGTATYPTNLTMAQINGYNNVYKLSLTSRHKIFSTCAGISEKEARDIYDKESVFNAAEAKNIGFVNEVRNVNTDSKDTYYNYDESKK